jgi:hypothetical protein
MLPSPERFDPAEEPGGRAVAVQVLDFRTGIDFGGGGNLKEFNPTGFSAASDAISTWSEAAVAELTFRLPALRHDLCFVIEVFPYLADGKIAQQACWVFMNGLFVSYRTVKTPVELSFTVPRQPPVVCSARCNCAKGFEARE